MKKYKLLLFVALLTILSSACGTKPAVNEEDDNDFSDESIEVEKIKEDNPTSTETGVEQVNDFINEAKEAYSDLRKISERYEELYHVFEAGEMDNLEFEEFLQDEIVPANQKLVKEIEAIHSPNEQTTEITRLLESAVNKQQLAFEKVLPAIESGDQLKTQETDKLLTQASESEKEFVIKVEQLSSDYAIE